MDTKIKKSLKLFITASLLCGLLAVGVPALSAFSGNSEVLHNPFNLVEGERDTAHSGTIIEPAWEETGKDMAAAGLSHVQVVPKDPYIRSNVDWSSWVFMNVEIPIFTERPNAGRQAVSLLNLNADNKWTLIADTTSGDSRTLIYGYNEILPGGNAGKKEEDRARTSSLFDSFQVVDGITLTNAYQGTIKITGSMMQSYGYGSIEDAAASRNMNHRISYVLSGGTISGEKRTYTDADLGTYIPPEPKRYGYNFTGWTPKTLPEDSTGVVTFTASWEQVVPEVRTIKLSKSSTSFVGNGTEEITYEYDGDGDISVNSSNDNVVDISLDQQNKKITVKYKNAGITTITISASATPYSTAASASFDVVCTRQDKPVTIDKSEITLSYGNLSTISYTYDGDGEVSVKSSNDTIATATINYDTKTITVKYVGAGEADITVTAAQTSHTNEANKTCHVTCNKRTGYITLSANSGTIGAGNTSITVQVNSSHGGAISVTRSSGSATNASVSGSTITFSRNGQTVGSTTFTVKSAATSQFTEASATYQLTVDKRNGYVNLSATSGTMTSGNSSVSITASTHGGTLSVTRTSGNAATATISGSTINFSRSGYNYGSCTFTVASAATTGYTAASCTYTLTVDRNYTTIIITAGGTNRNYRCGGYFTLPAGTTTADLYNMGYTDTTCTVNGKYLQATSLVYTDGDRKSEIVTLRIAVAKYGNSYTIYSKIRSSYSVLYGETTAKLYRYGTQTTLDYNAVLDGSTWYNMVGMN